MKSVEIIRVHLGNLLINEFFTNYHGTYIARITIAPPFF